ncbi:hypothetical protein [Nonomuraea sediminis]|uniref:hypothetical protein n=1 Tax=Nonomuraea sediminis TaxID=2835864 RepID=UPI001BDC6E45|nr:hypothetical protein [Nonomuraea sediminis]
MTTRVAPNPPSPYATADPSVRHLFPVPAFLKAPPLPGTLAPTGCAELAVVPPAPIELMPGQPLPDGLCAGCIASLEADTIQANTGPVTACDRCGMTTSHGRWCALCRAELHRITEREAR